LFDHEITAQPGRDAVGGGVAQVGRAEVVVGELGDVGSENSFDSP